MFVFFFFLERNEKANKQSPFQIDVQNLFLLINEYVQYMCVRDNGASLPEVQCHL